MRRAEETLEWPEEVVEGIVLTALPTIGQDGAPAYPIARNQLIELGRGALGR